MTTKADFSEDEWTRIKRAPFVAGMASEGVVVHRLGVVPTPVVAFEAARRGVLGAVISASHNPFHDNGIKLFAPGGTKLPDELEASIEADVLALPAPTGHPAQLVDDLPPHRGHLVGVAHVGLDHDCAAAECLDVVLHGPGLVDALQIDDRDVGTLTGQRPRVGRANALRGAGHDADLALEPLPHGSPSSACTP